MSPVRAALVASLHGGGAVVHQQVTAFEKRKAAAARAALTYKSTAPRPAKQIAPDRGRQGPRPRNAGADA